MIETVSKIKEAVSVLRRSDYFVSALGCRDASNDEIAVLLHTLMSDKIPEEKLKLLNNLYQNNPLTILMNISQDDTIANAAKSIERLNKKSKR